MALLLLCSGEVELTRPDPRSHRAVCSCGWSGLRRTFRCDAIEDRDEHAKGLR